MNVEARLAELIGPAAGRLHTARSRNDQVALDFRLWVKEELQKTEQALSGLIAAFLDRAEEHADTVMPGFTHLQTAQPVTFGHHCMAYVEMFGRDRQRVRHAIEHLDESPIGAAALAGTGYNIDRHMTAQALGFREPTRNSIDTVSDRDFALEFLSIASISAVHLSRLAEEIVIWSTPQFGFVTLPDDLTTGSSIMPQKKNPDAAELVRAKTGRINGSLIALLTVMKGLPLAYSKDMQEDKPPVFEAESLELAIAAMTGMVTDMTIRTDRMKAAAGSGYSTATDLADWLVREAGYDAAIDYKAGGVKEQIRQHCPRGVDVIYDKLMRGSISGSMPRCRSMPRSRRAVLTAEPRPRRSVCRSNGQIRRWDRCRGWRHDADCGCSWQRGAACRLRLARAAHPARRRKPADCPAWCHRAAKRR